MRLGIVECENVVFDLPLRSPFTTFVQRSFGQAMRIEDFTQYLLWEKKYSPHTVEAYGTDLSEFEGFLVSMQAPTEDASIDFQAVRAWVVHLMEQGYTPSSVNRKISALRSYFKYLLRRGAIRISPAWCGPW